MKDNIRLGLLLGVGLATLYSAWALGLFLLSGQEPFTKNQTSLPAVLLTYYAAGTVGGAVVGALLPLGRSLLGRVVLGVIAAFIFFFCVLVATEGPFWRWPESEWRNLAILALLFGTVCSLLWRRATGL